MKWGEWHRRCNVALDYYWPSDDMSEGGSSASRLQLNKTLESETMHKGSWEPTEIYTHEIHLF